MYDFKFDPILTYLVQSQHMIDNLDSELSQKYNEWEQKIKDGDYPHDYPDAYEIYEEEIMHLAEYGQIFRSSILLTVFGIFENELLKLCEWCKRAEGISAQVSKINRKSYIESYKIYLETKIRVDLSTLRSEWEKIQVFREIRNAFAHEVGFLKNSKASTRNYVSNQMGIKLKSNGQIELLNNDVVNDMIRTMNGYLSKVANLIEGQKK